MSATLQDLNGDLVVADPTVYSDKPVRQTNFYPTGIKTRDFQRSWEDWYKLPVNARYLGDGVYALECYSANYGRPLNVRLPDGGKTQCIDQKIEDIPAPKVRKGIELRWRNSRWEKYLKSEGWVVA